MALGFCLTRWKSAPYWSTNPTSGCSYQEVPIEIWTQRALTSFQPFSKSRVHGGMAAGGRRLQVTERGPQGISRSIVPAKERLCESVWQGRWQKPDCWAWLHRSAPLEPRISPKDGAPCAHLSDSFKGSRSSYQREKWDTWMSPWHSTLHFHAHSLSFISAVTWLPARNALTHKSGPPHPCCGHTMPAVTFGLLYLALNS